MSNKKFSGSIHTHSEFSRYDSTASVAELAARAKELGAESIALTDHGTLIGTWDFLDACKKVGIKGVPGCELYVMNTSGADGEDEDEGSEDAIGKRKHLVILCKNRDGWQALSKVVTASNHNISGQKPITTPDMLREWFGPGSIGHGNVIATSACMAGVICSEILINTNITEKQDKLRKKLAREKDPNSAEYLALKGQIQDLESLTNALAEERGLLSVLAAKKYTARLRAANKAGDQAVIDAVLAEQAESEEAAKKLPEVREREKVEKKKLTALKQEDKKLSVSHERYYAIMEEIETLEKQRVLDDVAFETAKATLDEYVKIFGAGNFFVEVQNHGIPEEAKAMPLVAQIAREKCVPLVASNDIHNVRKEDAEARACIFAQKYFWKEISEQDEQLYMKTDDEIEEWLAKILPADVVSEAISNISKVLAQCSVSFPYEEHYPAYPDEKGEIKLLRLCRENKKKIKRWTLEYEKRLHYEIGIITKLGFCDYLCIVWDFLNYARMLGKIDIEDPRFLEDPFNLDKLAELSKDGVGEGVGPGRGSAVGSLVCYLMGITNLDPIEHNLLFERFLNPERVTMPDIDSDIAIDIRGYVIDYIRHRYGENAVCQIMTQGFLAAKASIKAATRVYLAKKDISKKTNPDGYDKIMKIGDAMSKCIPNLGKMSDAEDALNTMAKENEVASEILRMAKLLDGRFTNIGTHAAGVIISDNNDVSDYVPMLDVGGVIASQCDKERTESLGMLKMDVLGLKNLSIITDAERVVRKATGKKISIDDLPFEKEVFENIFQNGNTNNVFQFESDGMKRVLTGFKPESFADLVLLVALYRPGPAQYIDTITAVKNGTEKATYIIPELKEVLGPTYGKPVFQEQIMAIFNRFAGFSLGEADIIRRHMAKKHYDDFAAYKDKFIEGLIARGAAPEDVESFWDELLDFASYAFNKSHAAAYAYVAYATAWFKYHYPEAYAIGVLNYESTDKIDFTIRSSINGGVKMLCPDVNRSEEKFSLYDGKVLYGLASIAQMTSAATAIIKERTENGLFTSFEDFLERVPVKSDALRNLILGGGFDSFGIGRQTLLANFENKQNIIKKIKEKRVKLEEETDETKISKLRSAIEQLKEELAVTEEVSETSKVKLQAEREVLGYYISQHPLETVTPPKKVDNIASIEDKDNATVVVFVSNIKVKKSKNTGEEMAFFTVEDRTGSCECCCFSKQYAISKELIKEGSILHISGGIKHNEDDTISLIANRIKDYVAENEHVILNVPSWNIWKAKEECVLPYTEEGGCPLWIFINGKCYKTKYLVSKDIEKANFVW